MEDQPPSKSRPRAIWITLLAVAVGVGAVVLRPTADEPATAVPAPSAPVLSASVAPSAAPAADQIRELLSAQAQALVAGDEAGWLAPVDTTLRPRYRTIFRNLRALDVTAADQGIDGEPKAAGTALTARVGLSYCFSGVHCPGYQTAATAGGPKMINKLTLTPRNGSWAITRMAASGITNYLQPAPWENTALTVARGDRVIVAGPRSQAANVARVLPLAEKAAAVADRYAGHLNNPQRKYRIYLADNKAWKRWYAEAAPPWSIAYHLQLNGTGSDIVLKTAKVMPEGNRYITEVIQHELGHAVTLNGNRNRDQDRDQWLVEGVAEYIGYQPGKPQNTYSRDALRYVQSRRGAGKTITLPPLTGKSDDLAVTRLYASGHFAAACMAEKYSEPKMLDFVQLVLHEGMDLDAASRIAYRKPFTTVDKACLSWIRRQL